MNELSASAAKNMRDHRKALFEAFGAVADVMLELGCPDHPAVHHDNCPACALEQKLSDIVGENSSVELGFDEMLENGPHPECELT
jgi:hypothetical protein